MASQRPEASNTLLVPEWPARVNSDTASRTDAVRLHDTEPMEFILSSNWVLRTEGINDFYEVLHKRDENLEIEYDPLLHGFRIKCLSHNEVKIVTLVKEILDQLVQKETVNGLDTSTKIISLDCWRKQKCHTREKIEVSGKFAFPRDVATCKIRATWNVSESSFKKGITTSRMLPESVLSKLRQLTNTVLITSCNGRTVYIGAPEVVKVRTVKQKLDTLAQFFLSTPRDVTEIIKIFLYSEGDRSILGEYRYVADGNDRLLRTYILDRFDWPHPDYRYPKIFQKSVMVRLNPKNEPWEEGRSLSNTVLPVVKDGNETEEFGAFKLRNWTYPAKVAASSIPGSDTSSTQLGSSLVAHQSRIRPKIENWVFSLPTPKDNGHSLSCQANSPAGSQPPESSRTVSEASETNRKGTELGRRLHISATDVANHDPATSGHENAKLHGLGPVTTLVTGRSSDDGCSVLVDHHNSQAHKHDPFKHLIGEFRRVAAQSTRGLSKDQSDDPNIHSSQPTQIREPQVTRDHEHDTRSFHVTMRQKAGSIALSRNVFPEFDPNMMTSINESLASLMVPMRMWSGVIDLEIELGRFYFLNVRKSQIQEPGDEDSGKHYKLSAIENELNKRHTSHEKLYFTRVLTSLGADANYIAHISDRDGNAMWTRPIDGRSSIYEFTCQFKTPAGEDLNFIVDIDATKFTSKVRQFKPKQNCFAVHCTKRVWDFRLVLSISQDLNDICGRFAEDLLRSLQVMPENDRIPELQVSYEKSYEIEVLAVRTRNTAHCIRETSINNTCSTQASSQKDTQKLYITEVWEMDRLDKTEDEKRIWLKFARLKDNNERSEMPIVWYEAVLKSDTLSVAFEQNENLELGDEVEWTSENLLQSGAVEALIQKAADMVKNMDGVGYWNENHQTDLLRNVRKPAKSQDVVEKFW